MANKRSCEPGEGLPLIRLTPAAFATLSPLRGARERKQGNRPHSRGALRARGLILRRALEMRRAHGTPGPGRTRGPQPLARLKRSDASRRSAARIVVTASPPTLRRPARGVSKPAPHDPRWTDLSGFRPHRRGSLSTASGASTCLGGWHRRYDTPPRAPGDARLARRDRAASAAGRGCPSLHPHSPATAACPSLVTFARPPLDGTG